MSERIYSIDYGGDEPLGITGIITDNGRLIIDGTISAKHVQAMLESIATCKRIAELESVNRGLCEAIGEALNAINPPLCLKFSSIQNAHSTLKQALFLYDRKQFNDMFPLPIEPASMAELQREANAELREAQDG